MFPRATTSSSSAARGECLIVWSNALNSCRCYSMIGRNGGRQGISIGESCVKASFRRFRWLLTPFFFWQMGVIEHEIGHALGLWHEQSRPDALGYVTVRNNQRERERRRWKRFRSRETSSCRLTSATSCNGTMRSTHWEYHTIWDQWCTTEALRSVWIRRARRWWRGTRCINRQSDRGRSCRFMMWLLSTVLIVKVRERGMIRRTNGFQMSAKGRRRSVRTEGTWGPRNAPSAFVPTVSEEIGARRTRTRKVIWSAKLFLKSEITDAECGGIIELTDDWKTIESPNYPDPGYDADQKCSWLLKASKGKRVEMEFIEDFSFLCTSTCVDFVEIKISDDLRNTGFRFCCYDKPEISFVSQTATAIVIFRSQLSTDIGFKIQVKSSENRKVRLLLLIKCFSWCGTTNYSCTNDYHYY